MVDDDASLRDYASVFGHALRSLHAARHADRQPSKPSFQRDFDLTSRQYNAVKFSLDGMESSIRELRPGRRADLKERIKAVAAKIKRLAKGKVFERHNLNRRHQRLVMKLARLQTEGHPRLCFGSRKLFNAQHHLADNGLVSHAEWQSTWKSKRDSQFFVLGSKDETAGCQGCVMTHLGDDRFAVRLRLDGKAKRYLAFEVQFAYGLEHIKAALALGQAMSYRFLLDDTGWRIFVSTKALETKAISEIRSGCIAVDLNVDHVAVSETDGFGNLLDHWRIPLATSGLAPTTASSNHAAQTAIGEVVKQIVGIACRARKPISIEQLDFARKKAQLSYASPKTQRMLSAFAYARFAQLIKARSYDAGIDLLVVNPAYSSKIGRQKYARRYGLSVHVAAALILARRAQKFSDRYIPSNSKHSATTCKDRGGHVAARLNGCAGSAKARLETYNWSPAASLLPPKGDPPLR